MLGYVGSYTLIGVAVVTVGFTVTDNSAGESGKFLPVLFTMLGLLLLWLTQRNWRKPPTADHKSPRLFAIIDNIAPRKALAFGALVTVINFKNLAIFLSAVSVSLVADLLLPAKIVIVLLVVLVFCASVIGPVLIYFAFPQQADKRLNWIKQTLETHSRPIGIGVPLIFGLIFLIRGITGLL
jgi:threonine/homoserine/homoserine lactone efflux protein